MPGFRTWAFDEVVSDTDFNNYIMEQVVICVANAAALPNAGSIGHEGMLAFQQDVDRYQSWNGVAWRGLVWNSQAGRMGCSLRRAAVQSMGHATNSGEFASLTPTAIIFDTEDFDGGGYWSSGVNVTVPTGYEGLYSATGSIYWAAAVDNQCYTELYLNPVSGADQRYPFYHENISTSTATFADVPLAAGDQIQLRALHRNIGAINATARLDMYRTAR
jgi:hypothetical protein